MPMTINTNNNSLNAQRNLGTSQSALATAMQRLSSGLRVNSAKDDAAGLAISERMNAQIKGMNVAARNANDGISLAQTGEGALGKIGDMLQRMRELAVQSANATNSVTDRAALQAEVAQLKEEIGRVATSTKFNGTALLDGTFTAQAFQVGANSGETITLASIANAQLAGLGTLTPPSTYVNTTPGSDLHGIPSLATSLDINGVTVSIAARGRPAPAPPSNDRHWSRRSTPPRRRRHRHRTGRRDDERRRGHHVGYGDRRCRWSSPTWSIRPVWPPAPPTARHDGRAPPRPASPT